MEEEEKKAEELKQAEEQKKHKRKVWIFALVMVGLLVFIASNASIKVTLLNGQQASISLFDWITYRITGLPTEGMQKSITEILNKSIGY